MKTWNNFFLFFYSFFEKKYIQLEINLKQTIFGEMLRLPNPVHKEVYYAVLLSDFLKAKPAIAPVVRTILAIKSLPINK